MYVCGGRVSGVSVSMCVRHNAELDPTLALTIIKDERILLPVVSDVNLCCTVMRANVNKHVRETHFNTFSTSRDFNECLSTVER